MNLHHITFKELLDLCVTLDNPADIDDMIESLAMLEKNIRYLRTSLAGKRLQLAIKESDKERTRREQRKQRLRVLSSQPKDDGKDE